MELEQILKLIDAVSESSLTSFSLEEGETKLTFAAERSKEIQMISQADSIHMSEVSEEKNETVNEKTEGIVIKSPLVGIFYSAASPNDEPFVKEGGNVRKGQTLGLIEAMKLMNEVESESDGIIKRVLVENGQMVEYGQPLFIIED